MLKRVALVGVSVLAGDYLASFILPKIKVEDDQTSFIDTYDVGAAIIIGFVYHFLSRLLSK